MDIIRELGQVEFAIRQGWNKQALKILGNVQDLFMQECSKHNRIADVPTCPECYNEAVDENDKIKVGV